MQDKSYSTHPLRYTIAMKLKEFDTEIQVKIKRKVAAKLLVHESTISRWINIRNNRDTGADIPATALYLFAELMNCKMIDLFNGDPFKK